MAGEIVLIVEDEPALLRGLKDNFVRAGWRVLTAADGEAGLAAACDSKPDLILLDIMLPGVNGFEICRELRAQGLETPILMLTAKSEESDIVLGLNLGADDYMTKPFSIRELLARANAMLRRRRQDTPEHVRFGAYVLDVSSRRLLHGKDEIVLTPKEFDLLALLASCPGRAIKRSEILRRVWGFGMFVTERCVDRCVTTLRAKIEPDPVHPQFVKTVRLVGYRFDAESDYTAS